ncbi:MAG: carboxypeptidase-like regulatory domain-containing protein [Myxococcales bacterium]|nr:carboxypeptidase-like regulatory domain-containing protein [Myxococcales bacterium]
MRASFGVSTCLAALIVWKAQSRNLPSAPGAAPDPAPKDSASAKTYESDRAPARSDRWASPFLRALPQFVVDPSFDDIPVPAQPDGAQRIDVQVCVFKDTGEPLPGVFVWLTAGGHETWDGFTGDDGCDALFDVAPGPATLAARWEGELVSSSQELRSAGEVLALIIPTESVGTSCGGGFVEEDFELELSPSHQDDTFGEPEPEPGPAAP